MKSLLYFSGITQRTLSAFHKAGIDMALLDEINDLKSHITKPKPLILYNAIPINKNQYKRIFTNGHNDIVDKSNLFKPAYLINDDIFELDNLMNDSISPISKMGLTLKLNTINTHRKIITLPTECIFFH